MEGSEGCSQEDILLETRDMEGLGLQLELPSGFGPMGEEPVPEAVSAAVASLPCCQTVSLTRSPSSLTRHPSSTL